MPVTPNPAKDKRDREHGWTTLANEPSGLSVPPLIGDGFDERAHGLWRQWWAGPLGCMFHPEVDADAMERLLRLKQNVWEPLEFDVDGKPTNKVTAAELSEIRQLEDRFGLSPAGRRRLFWRIQGVDTPRPLHLGQPEEGDVGPKSAPKAGGDDDPRRLRSVG